MPGFFWIRKNRGLFSAVLLSAICGTVAVKWVRDEGNALELQAIESPLSPLSEGVQAPIPLKSIATSRDPRPLEPLRAKVSAQTPKPERPKAVWETLEGEKRVSALVILSLSAEDLERTIRESKLDEISSIRTISPALRGLQSALKGVDERKSREKAAELLRLASLLETDEAFEQYSARRDYTDFSEEFKTVLIPAVKEAENLLSY